MNKSLDARNILITRPKGQAQNLCTMIEAVGGQSILFPTIEILPPNDPELLEQVIQDLMFVEIAIFVSANAVKHSLPLLKQFWSHLPPTLTIIAVGPATAKALSDANIGVDFCPTQEWNSEGVLALPALQVVKGKSIAIFSGAQGRDLLAQTLKQREAIITEAICYRRVAPKNLDTSTVINLLKRDALDAVVCSSNNGLTNLLELFPQDARSLILQIPLIVVSQRAAELAKKLGFSNRIIQTKAVSDEAILNELLNIT